MTVSTPRDRVGIGWRGDLAHGILANLHRLDVLEVIAEDWFDAPRSRLGALRTLSAQVPVWIHGVSLGLASSAPAERRRVDALARVVDAARPEGWSEHLAFVRGGGVEPGHLAAPPRNEGVLEGLARNLALARRVVGSTPLLENVATLVDPPGSDRDEPGFLAEAVAASGAGLLLDLHNLHANACNHGFGARAVPRGSAGGGGAGRSLAARGRCRGGHRSRRAPARGGVPRPEARASLRRCRRAADARGAVA